MTAQLVAAGVAPAEKFQTVYSGLEVEPLLESAEHRTPLRSQLGYDDGQIVVGMIARLFHLKGHEYLIAAARPAVEADPRLRFLLVGDGVLRDRIPPPDRSPALGEHFRFAGLVPPEQIPAYLAAMDIVVHTSLREGLARVLPQALIAAKPVISYDVDGAARSGHRRRDGLFAAARRGGRPDGRDSQAGRRPTAARPAGAAGRTRFADRFRHETMTADLRSLYARLLASGQRRV